MSNSSQEHTSSGDQDGGASEGITDDKLPEDLRPTDDNPLAKPPGEDETEDQQEGTSQGAPGVPDMGQPGAG